MSKKIVAFGASNSSKSINKQLATFAANQVSGATVNLLDLNHYEMPIYSIDRELATGIPDLAMDFRKQLSEADGIVISFAEYNGCYTSAFKNIFEWISRGGPNVWANKPMLLLATSPGERGAMTVLEIAVGKLSRMNTNKFESFSLPSFNDNFKEGEGITNSELNQKFQIVLQQFVHNIEA